MIVHLDDTPQDSDWDDMKEMLKDIRAFMHEHPGHDLLPADDFGCHYNPPRIARIGFVAFRTCSLEHRPKDWDEQMKTWTIPLGKMANTMDPLLDPLLLKTSKGRQELCLQLKSGTP